MLLVEVFSRVFNPHVCVCMLQLVPASCASANSHYLSAKTFESSYSLILLFCACLCKCGLRVSVYLRFPEIRQNIQISTLGFENFLGAILQRFILGIDYKLQRCLRVSKTVPKCTDFSAKFRKFSGVVHQTPILGMCYKLQDFKMH